MHRATARPAALPDANALELFARVAAAGSFAQAARELGLTRAAVSRRIEHIEQTVGGALFVRTTRVLALTAAGRRLAGRARAVLDAAEAARRAWRARPDDDDEGGEQFRGTLRITSVPAFGQAVLGPLLASFQARHPALRIELRFTSRRVDLPREDIDVAFRLTDHPPADCVALRVLPFVVRAYAAPDPARARWPLAGPEALAGERCLIFGGIGGVDDELTLPWQRDADGLRRAVTLQPAMIGDDLGSLQAVARAGGGVVLAPDFCARDDLARGTLAEVLPGWRLPVSEGSAVMALTLPWNLAPASARALVQHVRAALGASPAASAADAPADAAAGPAPGAAG